MSNLSLSFFLDRISFVSSRMGPFQECEENESMGKESPRSRIPRLVPPSCRPKANGSRLSESHTSEDECREYDLSSDHSKRTVSTNSFCSDDTGCPGSQLASASASGTENSPLGSPAPSKRKGNAKKVRVDTMAEWISPPSRFRREQRSSTLPRGTETDFSSSSSTGSIKSRQSLVSNSSGRKTSSSRSHDSGVGILKPALRDTEPYAPYRMPPRIQTFNSINSGLSPSSRSSASCFDGKPNPTQQQDTAPREERSATGRYHSCGENHGIKPPNPEQYLTPLQQKEVNIRHLKSRLRDSESQVHEMESEIEALKAQMGRMREDWIEEECHRVEAQLALKEARKEIKQLRRVVETMKSSLMEKDKGIQKYFVDINVQNKKLESLLYSMEMAQNGSVPEDPTLDFICESPGESRAKLEDGLMLGDQAAEEMADGSLLLHDELANQTDILEEILKASTTVDFSRELSSKLGAENSALPPNKVERIAVSDTMLQPSNEEKVLAEKGVQTDVVPYNPDLQTLLLHLLKLQGAGTLPVSAGHLELPPLQDPEATELNGLTPSDPTSSQVKPLGPEGADELDFAAAGGRQNDAALVEKRHWSSCFLVDLAALAVPVLPTVAWLYSTQRGGAVPVYNIAALIRGCCIVGLRSLRHVSAGASI